MIDAFTTFRIANIVSGFALIALGALAALPRRGRARATLALFLMAWGAQVALTNLAATQDRTTAFFLYLLGHAFLPLQAMFLLLHAAEELPRRDRARPVRWAAAAVLALAVAGFALALVPGSGFLGVEPNSEGLMALRLGGLSLLFFDAPQFIGVSAAFLLLAWAVPAGSGKPWLLLGGAAMAWAATVAVPAVAEFGYAGASALFLVLAVACLLVLAAGLSMAWRASRIRPPRGLAIALGAGVVVAGVAAAGLAALADGNSMVRAFGGPGVFRLAAAGIMLAALLTPEAWGEWRTLRALSLVGIVALSLLASGAFVAALLVGTLPPLWQDASTWAALAALGLIVALAARPTAEAMRGGSA